VIVTPDTVLWWQRRRFCRYWTQLSGRSTGGRPPVNAEIKALVTRMATTNPLWVAPRIHGEILKLGIDVAERTVSRLMPKTASPAFSDLAGVPRQPCSGLGLDRLLHRAHRPLARALRPRRARPPPPARHPLQRHRTSHRRLDRAADRGHFPGRHRLLSRSKRSYGLASVRVRSENIRARTYNARRHGLRRRVTVSTYDRTVGADDRGGAGRRRSQGLRPRAGSGDEARQLRGRRR
jgi:hypothetical protein